MDIIKANTVPFKVPITDANGNLVNNLSAITEILFMVKENKTDADGVALISKSLGSGITINDPSLGYIRIELSKDDTDITVGTYYMGLQLEWGSEHYEATLPDDEFVIVQDVIRS